MKAKFLKFVAVFALAALVLTSGTNMVMRLGVAAFVPGSVVMRNNFYFGKGQWLADTRTAIAAIQYLYRSRSPDPLEASNGVVRAEENLRRAALQSTNESVQTMESFSSAPAVSGA